LKKALENCAKNIEMKFHYYLSLLAGGINVHVDNNFKEYKYYSLLLYYNCGGYQTRAIKPTARHTVRLININYTLMMGLPVFFLPMVE
jgi:hypothetical protein